MVVTRRHVVLGACLVGLVAFLSWLIAYLLWFRGLMGAEALNQAQIARHLARGEGFRTSVATPLGLTFEPRVEGRADTTTPPLGPWWMSLFFRCLGANDSSAAVSAGAAFILSALALYWLGLRLAGAALAALIGALYSLSFPAVSSALSAPSLPLSALLVTSFFVALSYISPRPEGADEPTQWLGRTRLPLLAAGALAGLATLTEYYLALLPLAAVWYARGPDRLHRLRAAGWVTAGALVVLLPWAVRQASATRHPFFSVRAYDLAAEAWAYPGRSIYRELDAEIRSPAVTALLHLREMPRKWGVGLANMRQGLMHSGDVVLAALFAGGLLFPFQERRLGRLRGMLLVALLLTTATGCLLTTRVALVSAFGPAIAAFGLGRVAPLLVQLRRRSTRLRVGTGTALLGLLSLLIALPFVCAVIGLRERAVPNVAAFERLRAVLPADTVVMTDVPWQVAWRAERFAVELCNTDRQLDMIHDVIGVGALYLTGAASALPGREYAPGEERGDWWQFALRRTASYKGFELDPNWTSGGVLRHAMGDSEEGGGS